MVGLRGMPCITTPLPWEAAEQRGQLLPAGGPGTQLSRGPPLQEPAGREAGSWRLAGSPEQSGSERMQTAPASENTRGKWPPCEAEWGQPSPAGSEAAEERCCCPPTARCPGRHLPPGWQDPAGSSMGLVPPSPGPCVPGTPGGQLAGRLGAAWPHGGRSRPFGARHRDVLAQAASPLCGSPMQEVWKVSGRRRGTPPHPQPRQLGRTCLCQRHHQIRGDSP